MRSMKALMALLSLILLISVAVFFVMDGPPYRQGPTAPSHTSQQDELQKESPENPADLSDSGSSGDDLLTSASSDDMLSLLLPSQVVGRVFPKVDLDVLALRLPRDKFAVFERIRLEFPEVDWTEIEPTHLAFQNKRSEFPLNLNHEQREAYAAWLGEVEPVSRVLIKLRAEAHGLSAGGMEGDRGYYIDGFRNGAPIYVVTSNVGAATTTGVNYVRWNPSFDPALGDTINGGEFYVNVNDHGEIYEHTEFQLPNAGGSRILVKEVPWYENASRDHMTHVAGTMAAWGYNSNLQGMAPRAWIRALIQQNIGHITGYGMATPGQQMTVTNPRTGKLQLRSVVGNTSLGASEPYNRYDSSSASYDTVLRDYPYYMHFNSTGNSGSYGYESLTGGWKIAKNMIGIGNVSAVTRDANGVYTGGGNIAGSSSRGPTYDGRINPDFVGKGTSVTSTVNTTGTQTMTGTSMSSPNVAGSVALLMDYVRQRLPQQYLRSSTYRALLATTADDRGNPGPDYIYGWGILNIHAAATIVRQQAEDPSERLIVEDSLAPSQTWTVNYVSDGTKPIHFTIAWLDPASTNTHSDDRASRLVNDLDLRLIAPDGTEHRPYVMPFTTGQGTTPAFDPSLYNAHAVNGDNTTDPVEKVYIAAPAAGIYTARVTHKGNLLNNQAQPFSVAVSGLNNNFDVSMEVARGGSPISVGGVNGVSGTFAGLGTQLTYTISNVGGGQLELTAPVTISSRQNCSVTVNTQPSSPLYGGGSTNLVTTVTPASSGTWSFKISIANNDADKNPYTWTISGSAFGRHTLTYNGNNADSGTAPVDANSPYFESSTVTVLGNTGSLTKAGFSFAGWNTAVNGSGTTYAPGATFTMPGSAVTLYPVWNTPPVANAGTDKSVLLGDVGPWAPTKIATAGWYDASDATTITASSGQVSQWRDKSGKGLHLDQANSTQRPLTSSTIINGKNAIKFDGSDDTMTTASNPFGASISDAFVIAVHKVDAVAGGTFFTLTGNNALANRWQAHAPWGDGTVFFDTGGYSGGNRVSTSYGVSAGNHVLVGFYGSTTNNVQQVFKNGALLVGDATGHSANTAGNIFVGSAGAGGSYQNTSIGEFIMIKGTVTAAERQKLEGYLVHKWGLTASLPASHPYKSAAPSGPAVWVALNNASVTPDDGYVVTATWTVVSKPTGSTAIFNNSNLVNATVMLDSTGTYVLRLTANDGYSSIYDDITITVNESSGLSSFNSWVAAGGGGGVTFGGDANDDGLADGLSWLLGASSPSEQANALLPQPAESNGDLTLSFKMLNSSARGSAVLTLQHSMDLGVSDPWTSHSITVPDVSGTVSGVGFTISPIPGTDHNQVFATVPASAAGGTGKVFVRLGGVLSP